MTVAKSAPAASRDHFNNKIEYYLTALSYAVGLGNVWRFPYLCYRNGGGSFFVPYLLSLFFLGLTFFFFESTIGQFSSLGPIKVWRISPVFKGIGYAMFMMGTYVAIYYNMVIAWAIYYVYASFTSLPEVPWLNCNNTWNTNRCYMEVAGLLRNISATKSGSNLSLPTLSPSHEYFYNEVLEKSEDIGDLGLPRGHLVLCLALAWILVFLGLCLGAKSLGKVSYFTAIFPYVMITALLIKGVQLDGAIDGILHYIKPEFDKLTNVSVWADAATQIFFSLSICMGGVITLSSYNPYHNNTFKDSAIIVICNSLTSIYAGFAIFSVIGFMADQTGKLVEEAADQGVGLAFVAYPAALARLPISPFWSVVFFFMIITLGFGSQMTIVETVVSTIVDFWPSKLQTRKPYVLAATCFALFLCGLPLCTGAGIYILQLMDAYAVPYSAFFIGFFEVIAIAWVYGLDRHFENIHKMMGYMIWPKMYWHIIFKYGCPVFIVVILGMVISDFKPLTYNEYIFPQYTNYIGWAMSMSSVLMIPIFAIYEFSKVIMGKRSLKDILRPDVTFNNNDNNNNDCDSDDVNFDNKLNGDKKFLQNGTNGMKVTEEGEINHAFVSSEKIPISNGNAKQSNAQLLRYTSHWEQEQMQHPPPNLAIVSNGNIDKTLDAKSSLPYKNSV